MDVWGNGELRGEGEARKVTRQVQDVLSRP